MASNGHKQKAVEAGVESETIFPPSGETNDPRKLPPNIRLQMFNQELAALQEKFAVSLAISTQVVNPAYVVHQIQAIDTLRV